MEMLLIDLCVVVLQPLGREPENRDPFKGTESTYDAQPNKVQTLTKEQAAVLESCQEAFRVTEFSRGPPARSNREWENRSVFKVGRTCAEVRPPGIAYGSRDRFDIRDSGTV